jgi:hypothetical protein
MMILGLSARIRSTTSVGETNDMRRVKCIHSILVLNMYSRVLAVDASAPSIHP